MSFSLGLENGVQTRAISDGKSADMLVYAVFNSNGERISTIEQVSKTGVTFPTTESITLAKGQQYTVVFWAQDADCDAYTVSEDMKVTVDYDAEGGDNNDETRDAFFKAETFTVTGSTSINVVMKRPFAQINVGVTEEDWNAAVASGVEIAQSAVVIKNAATSINLIDGTVGEETTDVAVTYNPAAIPAETLEVDTDGDKVKESYKWLSMSYILVNDENGGSSKATLESEGLQFTFHPESGNDIMFFEGLNNVPVQRNWRTNILGQLLTDNITFNISIEPIYYGEYNNTDDFEGKNISLNGIYYETLEEAITAAQPGETIYVGTGEYTFPDITKNITIICEEGTVFNITAANNALDIAGSTIIGASFKNASKEDRIARGRVRGVFRNCHFEGSTHALRMCLATTKTEFENCTFVGEEYPFHFDEGIGDDNKIICNDCVFEGEKIEIAATVKMFEATNCDFNIEELVYMWGKAKYENCEFDKPSDKVGNKDYATYKNCTYDGRALTINDLVMTNDENYFAVANVNGQHFSQAFDAAGITRAISNAIPEYSPMKVLVESDITGNVEAHQQSGVDVIVDGQEHKYDGTIFIFGHSNNGQEILEFNNIKFETDKTPSQEFPYNGSHYFIWNNSQESDYRYAHNVTIKNCSFTATGNAEGVTCGSAFRQAYNLKIENCTSENLFYFSWAESCTGITIDNVTAENCYEGGISLRQSTGLVVENTTVTTTGNDYSYGIRVNANQNNQCLNVKNVNLSAGVPILLREATSANYTLALSGNNTLIKDCEYHIITTATDYKNGVTLSKPTGNITITGAEGFDVWDGNE